MIEELYRSHAGTVAAALTAKFGPENLDLIDAAVQEAFARAAASWGGEPPDSPVGWLITVAKNATIDQMRAAARRLAREQEVGAVWPEGADDVAARYADEIADDLLRMVFVCCDPALPPRSQVMLALRTLGGLSPEDIAAAYLDSEDAVHKRLTRARAALREAGVKMDLAADDLVARRDQVLGVLYGLFNEGYASHDADNPVRGELCREAIRLTALVADHASTRHAVADALLALMLLQGARLPGRVGDDGALLGLEEQDRGRWDQEMIAAGVSRLEISRRGGEVHRFHLEAGIAACHAVAPSFAGTDWTGIAGMYGRLMEIAPSPIVAINRAMAMGLTVGPDAGLAMLADVGDAGSAGYLLLAAQGDLLARQGDAVAARARFEAAAAIAPAGAARLGLTRRAALLSDVAG